MMRRLWQLVCSAKDSPFLWAVLSVNMFVEFCANIYLMHYDQAYVSIGFFTADLFFLGCMLRKRGTR